MLGGVSIRIYTVDVGMAIRDSTLNEAGRFIQDENSVRARSSGARRMNGTIVDAAGQHATHPALMGNHVGGVRLDRLDESDRREARECPELKLDISHFLLHPYGLFHQ